MRSILIPENEGDRRVLENGILVGRAICPSAGGWTVVDCNGVERERTDFATLDGAVACAMCLHDPIKVGNQWDREGELRRVLNERVGGLLAFQTVRTDPLATWDEAEGDHDELVRLFAEAVVDNANGCHVVQYLLEDHDMGGGTKETDCVVRITYSNECGATVSVDGALEAMNGYDWRNACDMFLALALKGKGLDPNGFDWPTPNARVSYDYNGDENDIVKDVTLSFVVDRKTWEALVRPKRGVVTGEVCNHCGGDLGGLDDHTMTVICPHCGKPSGVCCNCTEHEECARLYKECPYEKGQEKQ